METWTKTCGPPPSAGSPAWPRARRPRRSRGWDASLDLSQIQTPAQNQASRVEKAGISAPMYGWMYPLPSNYPGFDCDSSEVGPPNCKKQLFGGQGYPFWAGVEGKPAGEPQVRFSTQIILSQNRIPKTWASGVLWIAAIRLPLKQTGDAKKRHARIIPSQAASQLVPNIYPKKIDLR